MKLDFLHKVSEARNKTNGRFGFWQGKEPGLVLTAPAPSEYHEPVPAHEVDEFRERSLTQGDAANAVRATAALAARAIQEQYPDAECAYLMYGDDGDLFRVDVRDNYGSHVGKIDWESPAWHWVSELDCPSRDLDSDLRDEWHHQKHRALDVFKDPGFRTWPNQPDVGNDTIRLHIPGAVDWTPPRTDAQKVDDYLKRSGLTIENKSRAQISGAARAVVKDYPEAHSVLVKLVETPEGFDMNEAEVYDRDGKKLGVYEEWNGDRSEACHRLSIATSFGDHDEHFDDFQVNQARDEVAEEFNGPLQPWQGERVRGGRDTMEQWVDLSAAAAWLPPED